MQPRKAPAERPTLCPDSIDRLRQSYVATISRAKAFETAPNAMLDKATSLLTVHWGKSNWASRAAILKTVDWLLQVALKHPAPASKRQPIASVRGGPARV